MLQTFSTASLNRDGYAASADFRSSSKSGVIADMPALELCAKPAMSKCSRQHNYVRPSGLKQLGQQRALRQLYLLCLRSIRTWLARSRHCCASSRYTRWISGLRVCIAASSQAAARTRSRSILSWADTIANQRAKLPCSCHGVGEGAPQGSGLRHGRAKLTTTKVMRGRTSQVAKIKH